MEMSTRDDGKRGLAPTAPKAGRSAGATAVWKAPPTWCGRRRPPGAEGAAHRVGALLEPQPQEAW
eukprot:scaffold32763_cov55-Phaeocystis_antarctica.AAC.1